MDISDRAETIAAQFGRNYFGHVDPSFGGEGGWKDIEDLMIRLDESIDHPRRRINAESKQKVVWQTCEILLMQVPSWISPLPKHC